MAGAGTVSRYVVGQGGAPGPIGRALHRLSAGLAVAGGLVLVALIAVTSLSVAGRALFSAPIPGDFELVEIGCAVAVFAFLPYCQITRGNVVVDFFTARAPLRRRAALDLAGNLVFTAIAGLLTWRALVGAGEMLRYGETTMVLAVPIWWGFMPAVFCLGVLTLVCGYTAGRSLREMTTGRPHDGGGGATGA